MTLWLAFALMTAAAIFAVLWPLSRTGRLRSGSDIAVYRDQLDEIVRDRGAGLIGEAEAEAARVEVSRRLIAAGEAPTQDVPANPAAALWRRRAAALAALLFVPLAAGAIYLLHGSPQLPGEPLASRFAAAPDNNSIAALIAKVEAHLESAPNDARGWEVLAPVYLRLGRFDDAVRARRNALNLGGANAQREADLGEALVAASNGIVTTEAKTAFEQALTREPGEPKSQFYIGLAAQQDGDKAKAAAIWQDLLKTAPADAPWIPTVRDALAGLGETPAGRSAVPAIAGDAGPSAADMAAAGTMTQAQRAEMIGAMVARLADRLKQDGSDVEGWMRLVRAYIVLGERDKASAAAGAARRALASDPDKLHRIDELATGLGLNG
jgi:cytochrome c-type biogenesis protein CcmH